MANSSDQDFNSSDQNSNLLSIYLPVRDDGYKWKMYSKKLAMDTKFPKTLYMCIYPDCPVKKSVYKNSQEEIIVEYNEENHNHQPPNPTPSTTTELLDTRTGDVIYKDMEGNYWTCYRRHLNINGTGRPRAYYKCIYPNCLVRKYVHEDSIGSNNQEHNHQPFHLNIKNNILIESTQPKLQNSVETNSGVDVEPHPTRMRSTEVTTSEPYLSLKDIEEIWEGSSEVLNEVKLSEYIAEFEKLLD